MSFYRRAVPSFAAVEIPPITEEKPRSPPGAPLERPDTHTQEVEGQQSSPDGLRANDSLPGPEGEAIAAKLSDNPPLRHDTDKDIPVKSHESHEVSPASRPPLSGQQQIAMNNRKVRKLQNVRTNTLPLNHLGQSHPHMISFPSNDVPKYTSLSREAVDGVEKFVFFVGYGRSGSSIIGSILDAHPNAIIAHEFFLFRNWEIFPHNNKKKKYILFDTLYRTSCNSRVYGWRNSYMSQKGYTLGIKGLKQGEYDHLRVIGDKAAADTADIYWNTPDIFTKHYQELLDTVKVPIRVIHVVRNPYDMIATVTLYRASNIPEVKAIASPLHKLSNETILLHAFHNVFHRAAAVVEMKDIFNLTVLEVHSEDLIKDPKYTVQRLCDFLELECSDDYIQKCSEKAFTAVSRTRDLINWPPELKTMIEQEKEKYPFFQGYSFEQNYWME